MIIEHLYKMCELCKNTVTRDYTHAKNKQHVRVLMKKIKVKLESGYYISPSGTSPKLRE